MFAEIHLFSKTLLNHFKPFKFYLKMESQCKNSNYFQKFNKSFETIQLLFLNSKIFAEIQLFLKF